MALEVFFQSDIRRVLSALAAAGDGRGVEYRAALGHVALAFGVQVPDIGQGDDLGPVLDAVLDGGRRWVDVG